MQLKVLQVELHSMSAVDRQIDPRFHFVPPPLDRVLRRVNPVPPGRHARSRDLAYLANERLQCRESNLLLLQLNRFEGLHVLPSMRLRQLQVTHGSLVSEFSQDAVILSNLRDPARLLNSKASD